MRGSRVVAVGAALGAAGVALGAFGAHGLADTLRHNGPRAVEAWATASQYHMYAALAVIAAGLAAPHLSCKGAHVAAGLLTAGAALFSGSLYLWSLTGVRQLVFVTPVGGLLLILGFTALAWTCWSACGSCDGP